MDAHLLPAANSYVCPRCRRRGSGPGPCPWCDHHELLDLENPADRQYLEALAVLRPPLRTRIRDLGVDSAQAMGWVGLSGLVTALFVGVGGGHTALGAALGSASLGLFVVADRLRSLRCPPAPGSQDDGDLPLGLDDDGDSPLCALNTCPQCNGPVTARRRDRRTVVACGAPECSWVSILESRPTPTSALTPR